MKNGHRITEAFRRQNHAARYICYDGSSRLKIAAQGGREAIAEAMGPPGEEIGAFVAGLVEILRIQSVVIFGKSGARHDATREDIVCVIGEGELGAFEQGVFPGARGADDKDETTGAV